MQTSCGIIIKNECNEILMGHSTGNRFYDIPKGRMEDLETTVECAIRECMEETSLVFNKESLVDLGFHEYNRQKNIHIYGITVEKNTINMETLSCTTLFLHHYTKKMVPEFDSFKWVSINDVENYCAKSMGALLIKNMDKINEL